jgi:hypothetical protein
MISDTKPLAEVSKKAFRVLCKEMGVVNTVRFINQFSAGYGNYTEERKGLFGRLELNDILKVMASNKV